MKEKATNKDRIVVFKSIPEMYEREKDGRKPNTIRKVYYPSTRFDTLRKWAKSGKYGKITIIKNTLDEEFTRQITDYIEWDGYAVISWRHEDEK